MKSFSRIAAVVFVGLSLCAPGFASEAWVIDANHSDASFRVRHFVSKVSGRFNEMAGEVMIDEADPSKSSVTFTIKTASIDTANERRDGHLKSADFFDVETHPEITFKSTAIEKKSDSKFDVEGELTMHGVTKKVVLPVEFMGVMGDKAGFSIRTEIERKDYGIIWNRALDEGGYVLGDEVDVEINLELNKKKEEAEES